MKSERWIWISLCDSLGKFIKESSCYIIILKILGMMLPSSLGKWDWKGHQTLIKSSHPHSDVEYCQQVSCGLANVVWTCECRVDLRVSCGLASIVWTCECRVDLRVAKQHPCMGKESEGGFSPEYILVSFQTLTPSSGQPKADHPVWDKAMLTPDRLEKILPILEVD